MYFKRRHIIICKYQAFELKFGLRGPNLPHAPILRPSHTKQNKEKPEQFSSVDIVTRPNDNDVISSEQWWCHQFSTFSKDVLGARMWIKAWSWLKTDRLFSLKFGSCWELYNLHNGRWKSSYVILTSKLAKGFCKAPPKSCLVYFFNQIHNSLELPQT